MSGLKKAKQYDWKDSNLALFGSDLEKNVKKESASGEPAWKNAGKEVGVQIWRIVKFKVQHWPKDSYGSFFNGDSYIVLNTYKEDDSDELQYDVHFWIGAESSQDEYGTAAYKTVELDTFLDDKPVQHREVQGYESSMFKSYFNTLSIMRGGAESGFRHVKPEEYKPRLLLFCGTRKNIEVRELALDRSKLSSDDVFILDMGVRVFQWNGSKANKDERMKAMQYLTSLKSERSGRLESETLDESDTGENHEFYESLKEESDDSGADSVAKDTTKELHRLSDASGSMEFSLAKKGDISKTDFDTKDVFIMDSKSELFVWIGLGASSGEKKNAMQYAHAFLQKTDHPFVPVSCFSEGRESKQFKSALAA